MTIRHIVLLRFKQDTPASEQAHCVRDFADLAALIDGIAAFEHGANISPEGLDKGYTHAATITFASPASRDAYLVHAAHLAFVARLKPWLDEVLVFDYRV